MQRSYDGFGRVNSEAYKAIDINNERQSTKSVKYSYLNGYLKNIKDSEQDIFEINQVNHRGQLTDAIIGTNEILQRVYDDYGFIKNNIVYTNSSLLMERSTDFDPITGNLLSRSNSMFSWGETFEYDGLDRLISSTDNNGVHTMNYDDFGRITGDTHLGDFNYSGTSYQPDDIDLNIRGDLHYQRNQLQQIKYNAFKKPHEIYNEGIERISFQYNAFEQRSNMFYGNLAEEPQERSMRKHYSFDGSMEMVYNNETDETTFTTFVGGDAYSAPAIWKSIQGGESEHEDSYYFLHRDYLGSIVLITDGNGTALERRHFDAWGKIDKLTDGEGNQLEKLTITDRGYTGHEHLQDVGLVHMNGRLYDPNLKRMLSPDNYIQDMSNSQNFNRYAYVMNNPLKYIDPSGMMYENGGGLSPSDQTLIGGLISSAVNYLDEQNITWDDVGSFLNDAGTLWSKPYREVGRFFSRTWDKIFGKKEKNRSITISNYEALNNDPMVGPSTRVQDSFFGGGGDIVGNLGITAGDVLDTVTDFIPLVSGGKDIYQGIRDGNWWQVAAGVGSIGLDILTGGTSSLVKGAVKTGIKQGGKYLIKKYADDALKYANNKISSQYSRIISNADDAAKSSTQGGLNLFKWGAPQTGKNVGWKTGDYMLQLPNKGTPKLNWKANYGALRREMGLGKPIFDSYRTTGGNLIPTKGFLNAERSILQGRGWIYNPSKGA